jgi:aldose sugar dehydrogenase
MNDESMHEARKLHKYSFIVETSQLHQDIVRGPLLRPTFIIGSFAIILAANLAGLPVVSHSQELALSSKWGGYGTDSGRLKTPQGIAIDSNNSIFVADTGNHRIQKFSSDGKFIARWGTYGEGDLNLRQPRGIAVDPAGNVFVADTGNNRIVKFSSNGTYLMKWGSYGIANGLFNYPIGIAADHLGDILVSDSANNRIQRFTNDGKFLGTFGGYGISDGRFKFPQNIAVRPSGEILVVDGMNNRIQVLSSNGTFLSKWGSFGSDNGKFVSPVGITIDYLGNVFVADSGNNRIQKFSATGTFVASLGDYGVLDGQLRFPSGMTADKLGNIFVSDSVNNRILIYAADPLAEYYDDVNNDLYSTPFIIDKNLKVEVVAEGLAFPTAMTFVGPDDILVLQKGIPEVRMISESNLTENALLEIDAGRVITCMCGLATFQDSNTTYVFLNYYTIGKEQEGAEPIGIRVIRYELEDDRLVNPKQLLFVPSAETAIHLGGKVIVGPDNNLYIPVGDIDGRKTVAQNVVEGPDADLTSGIIRLTIDGDAVDNPTLGNQEPLNKYYAYGVRNSFGLAFDPMSGRLWDTENGPEFGDEINLVEPGFNSGWRLVQGSSQNREGFSSDDLVDFDNQGNYSDPEFEWRFPVGPTDIVFPAARTLGEQYENDVLVGDINNGYIYHFDLNEQRTELLLNGTLADRMANNINESKEVVFGFGFGGITDMEIGPDGYLYVVSFGHGKIYRVVPTAIGVSE